MVDVLRWHTSMGSMRLSRYRLEGMAVNYERNVHPLFAEAEVGRSVYNLVL